MHAARIDGLDPAQGGRAELAALPMTVNEVERADRARSTPACSVSTDTRKPKRLRCLWSTAQRDLTARYPALVNSSRSGGHYIHLDQRAWFVEAVRGFVGETTPVIRATF